MTRLGDHVTMGDPTTVSRGGALGLNHDPFVDHDRMVEPDGMVECEVEI